MKWHYRYAQNHPPNLVLGDPATPSLLRWHLIPRNWFFNVYLHKWMDSDRDKVLHDHPYANISVVLEGSYVEQTKRGLRRYGAGAIKLRRAKSPHRIIMNTGKPCWTIFITGPRIREWGFHCPNGWKDWKSFVKLRNAGDPSGGCGD